MRLKRRQLVALAARAMGPDVPDNHRRECKRRRDWSRLLALVQSHHTRDSGLALADQIVASATNFLTGVIVGRTCAPSEFGLYLLGFSIVTIAMTGQNTLVIAPFTVLRPRLNARQGAVYSGSTLVHQVGLSLITLVALATALVVITRSTAPKGLANVVFALLLAITFILLREFARRLCFANLQFRTAIILDTASAVLQLGMLAIAAANDVVSANVAYRIIGAASAVVAVSWLVLYRRSFIVSRPRVREDLAANWSIGKWLLASALLWESNVTLYPWLLTAFHGTETTGVWAACFGVIAIANPLILGMQNSLGPQMAHAFARGGLPQLQRFMRWATAIFSLIIAPIAAFILLFGGNLVEFIYGDAYSNHGWVVVPLALELLIAPVRYVVSRALVVIGRSDVDFVTNTVSLIVLLAAGIWLARALGPLGVAMGILAGSVGTTIVKYISYRIIVRGQRQPANLPS